MAQEESGDGGGGASVETVIDFITEFNANATLFEQTATQLLNQVSASEDEVATNDQIVLIGTQIDNLLRRVARLEGDPNDRPPQSGHAEGY